MHDLPNPIFLPDALNIVIELDSPDGKVFVTRASCVGGATLGTLRGTSYLMIFNPHATDDGTGTAQIIVQAYGFLVNNQDEQFFQRHFSAKLADRLPLTYAPKGGVITAYDLDARECLWIG